MTAQSELLHELPHDDVLQLDPHELVDEHELVESETDEQDEPRV